VEINKTCFLCKIKVNLWDSYVKSRFLEGIEKANSNILASSESVFCWNKHRTNRNIFNSFLISNITQKKYLLHHKVFWPEKKRILFFNSKKREYDFNYLGYFRHFLKEKMPYFYLQIIHYFISSKLSKQADIKL